MAEKKKKSIPVKKDVKAVVENDRLNDLEKYLDKVDLTMENIISRLKAIEGQLDNINLDHNSLKHDVKIIKPRLGLL